MNDFSERQNSKEIIDLLKYQRFEYNRISKLASLNFVISVVIPIILSLIGLFNLPDNVIVYINFLGALCTICCIYLSTKIKSMKDFASQIQYFADIKLFQMKPNKLIFRQGQVDIYSQSQKAKIQKVKGVNNWYSISNTLDINHAIFSCQQQNLRWDKRLRKFYLILISFLGIISVIIISSIAILKNVGFSILWSYILLFIPIISFFLSFIFSCISNIKEQSKLLCTIQEYRSTKSLSINKLEKLEESIYFYRKELVKIPNWFFKLTWKHIQTEADNYSIVEEDLNKK